MCGADAFGVRTHHLGTGLHFTMTSGVASSDQAASIPGRRFWIALLLVSFVMPFFFFVGTLKLNAYRIVLLLLFVPVVYFWLSGRSGRVKGIDFLVLLTGFWPVLALLVNHGLAQTWQFSGMYIVEAMTPYFIARTMIRDLPSYRFFVWFLSMIILMLLPFAIYENLTNKAIIIDFLGKFLDVYRDTNKDPRLGLWRAQVTLPHPILFGLFCSAAFGLSLYTLRTKSGRRGKWRYPLIAIAAVFSSLSSGAFMSVVGQLILVTWDFILRKVKQRWKIFLVLAAIFYVVLELSTKRTVFQIAATELTFDAHNSWNRVLIARFTADDIARNPIFGLGFRDWTRPAWMKSSVDNFWLVQVLKYGYPQLIAWIAMLITFFVQVGRAQLTGLTALARTGHLITLFGMSFAVITVHMWDAVFCLYMFLLGAGVWFLDAPADGEAAVQPEADKLRRPPLKYTRFPAGAQNQRAGHAS